MRAFYTQLSGWQYITRCSRQKKSFGAHIKDSSLGRDLQEPNASAWKRFGRYFLPSSSIAFFCVLGRIWVSSWQELASEQGTNPLWKRRAAPAFSRACLQRLMAQGWHCWEECWICLYKQAVGLLVDKSSTERQKKQWDWFHWVMNGNGHLPLQTNCRFADKWNWVLEDERNNGGETMNSIRIQN